MAEPQPVSPSTPPPDYDDVIQKEQLPPSYKSLEAETVVTTQPLPETTSIPLQPEEPTPTRCGDSFEPYFDANKTNCLVCCLCTVFCLPLVATCSFLQMCLLDVVDCCCGNSDNGRYTANNDTAETGAVVSGVDPRNDLNSGPVDSCCLFCCDDCSGGYDPGPGDSGGSDTRYGGETSVWAADMGTGGGDDGGFWGGGNDFSGNDSGGWGGGDSGACDSGGGGGGCDSGGCDSGGGGGCD